MLLGGQTIVSHVRLSTLSAHCIVQYWPGFGFPIVRLSRKPHRSQISLAKLIVRLEQRQVVGWKVGRVFRTVCSHLASFNTSHVCFGGLVWASAEQRRKLVTQSLWGWKWSGWNRTNRTGGYTALEYGALRNLRQVKHCLPLHTRELLYRAVVLPIVEYCSLVWDPSTAILKAKLESSEN